MNSLSDEQTEALIRLVQAARSVPRSERQPFFAFNTVSSHNLILSHAGLGADKLEIYPEDLQALSTFGLVRLRRDQNAYNFDVTEQGFRAYDEIQRRQGNPPLIIEREVTRYLGDPGFQRRHASAYGKWKAATDLLWSADAQAQLTQIGHLCREAIIEFCGSLLAQRPATNAPSDPTKTKDRIQAVLVALPNLGDAELGLLQALHGYWAATVDFIQRQEHGAIKEGRPLGWEDARRAVTATMVAMYELDRAVDSRRGT